MVVGLSLLSTMDAHTSRLAASAFMFVFGLGLGLVMQVLVLAVQNAVDYRDLGVATSGATLFRSIGGAVGTAVLGAIFSNRLSSELAASLPASARGALGSGGSVTLDTTKLARLPPAVHTLYLSAFTNALSTVFVVAAAIAAVAFALSWLIEQRPLRESIAAGNGVGESFAMPRDTDSLAEASRALTALVGADGRRQLVERLAERAGVTLSAAASSDRPPAGGPRGGHRHPVSRFRAARRGRRTRPGRARGRRTGVGRTGHEPGPGPGPGQGRPAGRHRGRRGHC